MIFNYPLFLSIFAILTACTAEDRSKPGEVTGSTSAIVKPVTIAKDTLTTVDTSIGIAYITGKFNPSQHPDFQLIKTGHASRPGMYLRNETYEAFKKMHEAAQKEGIKLLIISATRNFAAQKAIWEAKWTGERRIENGKDASQAYKDPKERALKILEYSSMPGTSRHHWGTDMDLNNLTNGYFENGKGLKEYQWLKANAGKFGFCQPYTAGRSSGYLEEKWHWSYIPIAGRLTQQAELRLTDEMISGFLGAETAKSINVVQNYILGINQECLE